MDWLKMVFLVLLMEIVLVNTYLGTSAEAAEVVDLWAQTIGTAPLGMGGAAAASSQGVFSASWNPAGLGQVSNWAVGSQYSQLFGEVSRFGFSCAASLLGGGMSVGYINESTTGIPLTSIDPATGRPRLEGYFSEAQQGLGLAYARPLIWPGFYVGAMAKFLTHSLYDQKTKGYGVDLGAIYRLPGDKMGLGLVARNILRSPFVWSSGHQEFLARAVTAGMNYQIEIWQRPLSVSLDADISRQASAKWHLGGQIWLAPVLALRLGSNAGQFTSGVGIRSGNFGLDYAYSGQRDLGAIHQVSLSWTL